jgi:hypothetical protein
LNASRNHTLTLIGPAVTDHDNALMSEVVTKQDLYNVGVLIDSNFKSLAGDIHNLRTDMDAQFVRVDSQFVAVRSEMREMFVAFRDEINKTTMRTGFATFLAVVALFGIDRWWS